MLPRDDLNAAWVEGSPRTALDRGSMIVRSLAFIEFEANGEWPQVVRRYS